MSEKIEVFKCDKCGTGCLTSELDNCNQPDVCIYKDTNEKSNWKPTNDYQIVKKGQIVIDPESMELDKMYLCERLETTDGPLIVILNIEDEIHNGATFKDFVISKKPGPTTFQASDFATVPQTPNCAICEWCEATEDEEEISRRPIWFNCTAQGMRDAHQDGVYNSPECQKLFQPKMTWC